MIDHLPAPAAMVIRGVLGFTGGCLYSVVVAQPTWLPLACAFIAAFPSAWRIYRDHRLKHALAETERQKRRAELAEAKLAEKPA